MSAASILDSMVSVTSLNHGGASKALSQVGDNHPVVVLKNNQPSAVIITPVDYRRLTQAEKISRYTAKPWNAYATMTAHC